jgi:hypothetical protein
MQSDADYVSNKEPGDGPTLPRSTFPLTTTLLSNTTITSSTNGRRTFSGNTRTKGFHCVKSAYRSFHFRPRSSNRFLPQSAPVSEVMSKVNAHILDVVFRGYCGSGNHSRRIPHRLYLP